MATSVTELGYLEGHQWGKRGSVQHEVKKWSEVAQSCLTLCEPMDCSLPGCFVLGILWARILEWVAISFSRRSSQHRDRTCVSHIAGRCFTLWATRAAQMKVKVIQSCLTLCDPMDYTVHGILQARILEWVAFPFSSIRSSQPRDQTQVSHIAGGFLTGWATISCGA